MNILMNLCFELISHLTQIKLKLIINSITFREIFQNVIQHLKIRIKKGKTERKFRLNNCIRISPSLRIVSVI